MIAAYCAVHDGVLRRAFLADEEFCTWAARMVRGECGPRPVEEEIAACLWAITHRTILQKATPARIKLAKKHGVVTANPAVAVMRMFSQPINPRWAPGGDKIKKYAGNPLASPARQKWRALLQRLDYGAIPSRITRPVEWFCTGALPLPQSVMSLERSRISDWGSVAVMRTLPQRHPHGIDIAGNWYFENRGLLDDTVEVLR